MTRSVLGIVLGLFGLIVTAALAVSQQPSATPTLTTEQKQAIQILAQRIELAQLRAQAAQTEFEKARSELETLLGSLKRDGFDLNLQTMAYVKKDAAVKK